MFVSLSNKSGRNDPYEPFIIIDKNQHEIDPQQNIICITNLGDFESFPKNVQTSLINKINLLITSDDTLKVSLQKASSALHFAIQTILLDFDFDFLLTDKEVDISKFLKLYDFTVGKTLSTTFDKLINLVSLYGEVLPNSLLCFFNIKEWFSKNEINDLYRHIINNQINTIFFESVECAEIINNERKLLIDCNYDELIIN